ncbi:hypothetical protein [uncultured Leifsonia sp.]|uniref:hypothetical protein n=1 Tax=uncultured Leifsonia sp. TaxID=340359 RepID=UPI0025F7B656|nr:hypothetical protein [uncultured Leifsonia sp.]
MTRDVLRALGRRWYVLVAGLLITAGLAVGAYRITPPNYTASGLILLLPSKTAIGPGGNPFLALSDLDQPAGILVAYFSGSSAQAHVKAEAPTARYQVLINTSARGPIIEVDVTDKSSAGALKALDYVTEQVPVVLDRLQTQVSAPADAIITSMPLTIDSKAKADYSGTIRIVIAAVVIGLLLTGIVAFALDGLLASRKARRQARREHDDTEVAAPAAATETAHPKRPRRGAREPAPPTPVATDGPADAHPADENAHLANEMVSQLSGRAPAESGREP